MIELRNRGKYAKSVEEDLQNIADTTSFFLTQIFDQDGNFIRPEQRSVVKYISPVLDISINNGNTEGSSLIPQAVDPAKTVVSFLGQKGGGGGGNASDCQIFNHTSTRVYARRVGTLGDVNITYQVVEFY